jgi:hypothetical protein
MDAPTEWTYGGLVDWTSPNTLRLAPTGLVLRCIFEAAKEKLEIYPLEPIYTNSLSTRQTVHTYFPEILNNPWNPLLPISNFVSELDYYFLRNLCYYFLRYLDISGLTIDGGYIDDTDRLRELENIFYYNPSTDYLYLLDDIGDESFIELMPLSAQLADWCFQYYQILNKLHIVFNDICIDNFDEAYKPWDSPTEPNDWVECPTYQAGVTASINYYGYYAVRIRNRYSATDLPAKLKDIYWLNYIRKPPGSYPTIIFNSQGNVDYQGNELENKWHYLTKETTSNTSITGNYYNDIDSYPSVYTSYPTGWYASSRRLIIDYKNLNFQAPAE